MQDPDFRIVEEHMDHPHSYVGFTHKPPVGGVDGAYIEAREPEIVKEKPVKTSNAILTKIFLFGILIN